MRRQLLINEGDTLEVKVAAAATKDPAPWGYPNLLGQMQCVMWDGHAKQWDARARNAPGYAHDVDVEKAMRKAIAMRDAPKPVRRQLEEEDA